MRIASGDLDVLTDAYDRDVLLNGAELDAINEVTSYLAIKYDTDQIFNIEQPESDKSATINRIVADIAIYNLSNLINSRNIPESRINLRDDAIKWLSAIADPRGNITAPFLPPREYADKSKGDISWGGRPKNKNYY